MAGFLCNQAAEEIHFIRTGYGNQDICILNTCFHQRVDTCTVSHDTHGINVILKGSDHIRRNVYKSNVGFFFLKLFCQGTSNFTAPNNNYLHNSSNKGAVT